MGPRPYAESVLLKHQQLMARSSVGKSLRLTTSDRFLCGFLTLFIRPGRIRKVAVVLKPATLAKFRRALFSRNYHRLFSSRKNGKPGPKGPSDDVAIFPRATPFAERRMKTRRHNHHDCHPNCGAIDLEPKNGGIEQQSQSLPHAWSSERNQIFKNQHRGSDQPC